MQQRFTKAGRQIPAAVRTNPFQALGAMAKQFDAMRQAFAAGHPGLVDGAGGHHHAGNAMVTAFWRGYEGQAPRSTPRQQLVWASYRAGQAQRLLDAELGTARAVLQLERRG